MADSRDALDLPVAILAGGLATRLLPLTENLPKSLVDVAGKPFLERQLTLLRNEGVRRVVLCLGHLASQVQSRFGDGAAFGLHITYSIDGPSPLGTGGAILKALPNLGSEFLVTYGDSYLPVNFRQVVAAFRTSARPALMTVYRNRDRFDKSNVSFNESEILEYSKNSRSGRMQHIDYGLMAFHASVFQRYPEDRKIDLADILTDLVHARKLAGLEVGQRFYEIGSLEGLAELNRIFNDSNSFTP